MNQKNITPKIIELAKAIAELWRMEIYEGCWAILRWQTPFLVKDEHSVKWATEQKAIPIPSISDCLDKLRELGWTSLEMFEIDDGNWFASFQFNVAQPRLVQKNAPTLHEALLSALLEVMK